MSWWQAPQAGAFDSAGEVGHMIVAPGGRPCPCGQRGCLERYASARAIVERMTEAVEAGERSTLADRARTAGGGLTAEDVQAAARIGDETARRVWDQACEMLAIACVNLQHLLNPQAIILGGGLECIEDISQSCFRLALAGGASHRAIEWIAAELLDQPALDVEHQSCPVRRLSCARRFDTCLQPAANRARYLLSASRAVPGSMLPSYTCDPGREPPSTFRPTRARVNANTD